MGSRHGRKPPYEIMQSVGSGQPMPRSRVRNVRGGSVGPVGLVLGAVAGATKTIWHGLVAIPAWIGGAVSRGGPGSSAVSSGGGGGVMGRVARPVEFRLPWGVVALLGVVVVALLGLMFQVGQHTAAGPGAPGQSADASDPGGRAEAEAGQDAVSAHEIGDSGSVTAMGSLPIEPQEAQGGGIALTDPRAIGRNYFILATVRPAQVEGVRELQHFLASQGLETFLDKANNDRFRVLVDVTRGFTADEIGRVEAAEHRYRIQALGRLFQKSKNGLGTDLSDVYLDRFEGPAN